ncbi:RHS repeat-associated core domain-containing protein, partial [Verrucomicrobiaceae bacterium N1E253]
MSSCNCPPDKQRDAPDNGFNYYAYRYYDPVTGRWKSRDPIEEQGGINVYGMIDNDSINYYDVKGLERRPRFIPLPQPPGGGNANVRPAPPQKVPGPPNPPFNPNAGMMWIALEEAMIEVEINKCCMEMLPDGVAPLLRYLLGPLPIIEVAEGSSTGGGMNGARAAEQKAETKA